MFFERTACLALATIALALASAPAARAQVPVAGLRDASAATGVCALGGPRFRATAEGVLDLVTGLVWSRCALPTRFDAATGRCEGTVAATDSFEVAQRLVQGTAAEPGGGWRLPSIDELSAVFAPGCGPADLKRSPLSEAGGLPLWSASRGDGDTAWQMDLESPSWKAQAVPAESSPAVILGIRRMATPVSAGQPGAGAVSDTEIGAYYHQHPRLFAERRVYSLAEVDIDARPDQLPGLRDRLGAANSLKAFIDQLGADGFTYTTTQAHRAAEQLAPAVLESVSQLKEGQGRFMPRPGGARVLILLGSRAQPVTLDQVREVIAKVLSARQRR